MIILAKNKIKAKSNNSKPLTSKDFESKLKKTNPLKTKAMKKIIVNGRTLFYNGDPLEVFRGYNKKLNGPIYSGRNNFFVRKKTKTCCEAGSIKDCFDFLKKCTNRNNHLFGFVLDFSTKTVYYDNQNALEYLNVQHLPKRGYDGFFENFIQKEVWSN